MISYWEKVSFLNYDYVIVGGGIVGFSTALSLRDNYPKASILVLESGFLPSGASTKNAGFACVGSLSEIIEDLRTHTEEEVCELVKLRKDGLELLKKRLGENRIGYQGYGSHELIFHHELHLLEHIKKINTLLGNIYAVPIFEERAQDISSFGFSSEVKTTIYNRAEGSIHTGKMMKNLISKAQSLGIEYKTRNQVVALDEDNTGVLVHIKDEEGRIRANKVFICTNAFSKTLLPELDLKPGRGQVLITKPIPGLSLKGTFHFDQGYYYFREIDGRILFGGGRNIDFINEESTLDELNEKIQHDLEQKLRHLILPSYEVAIDQRWTGIMAFGSQKKPIVKAISPRIFAGVRLGGMGVAIGSQLGEILAGFAD